jgi:glycosyltransferase involved in cell wall biosynthesis
MYKDPIQELADEHKRNPVVSVVIPTIPSRKHLLERALKSVNNQTYMKKNPYRMEIIVVDEGKPATVQRNIGIDRCRGKYIAFLDDDDTWMPDKIEKQVSYMETYDDCCLVIHWSHDKRVGDGRINKPPLDIDFKTLLKGFQLSSTSSYLVRKDALDEIKEIYGYLYDERLPSGHEYDLALRLSKHFGNIHCIQEVLMTQYKTPGQISENWGKKIRGQYMFMQKWGKHYSIVDYCKRLGVAGLFFMGFFLGDKVMYPINFMKQRFET